MCNKEEQHISLFQFLKQFPDEESAIKFYEEQRWVNGVRCPFCDKKEFVEKVESKKPLPYRCKDCRKYFSVKTGTVMQSSKISLQKWLLVTYLMTTAKKGISSCQLAREIGITQKTAWFLMQKIRESWTIANGLFCSGELEVDETYIGGKEKNKHLDKKLKSGRGTTGKDAVIGILDREQKKVKAFPLENVNKQSVHEVIKENIVEGSTIYTDEHRSYEGLKRYNHQTINHSIGEYVKHQASTNRIESFWALLKRAYYGTYHFFTEKHLHRYIGEAATRYNTRFMEPLERIGHYIRLTVDKKLTYSELTM